jgi:hypothetical protein
MGPAPKCHFVLGFPSWSLKIPIVGTSVTLGAHNLWVNLRWRWGLKKNFSPCQDLSNDMSHATCTQGNWRNYWLLVVGSQIVNLTPDPSFGHNLCFKCLNGSCELILNIFVPRNFQWYKELLNPMVFDSCNYSLKIWKSI